MNDCLHVKQNRSTKSTHSPLSEVSLYTVSGQLTIAGQAPEWRTVVQWGMREREEKRKEMSVGERGEYFEDVGWLSPIRHM